MVRDAVLDGVDAGVLAGAGRKDSVGRVAHVVPEAAASHPDWPGAGGMRAVFAAPVVSRRLVSTHQGKARSTLVHAVSDHIVLSLGDSGRAGGDGDGALSVRAFPERAARS